MKNNVAYNNERKAPDGTLKETALLYFKEALFDEKFEDCTALLKAAKKFGAKQTEISELIAEYLGAKNPNQQNEAHQKIKTRPRF